MVRLKPMDRRWPHFMDFEIVDSFAPSEIKEKIYFKREEFAKSFADSYNYGKGAPVPLSQGQWEILIDKLNMLKERFYTR